MADDLGYGDVQAYNERGGIPTPHMNRLAQRGMRFTDAHTPSAVCTPTRYGLLTGRYSWRTHMKRGVLRGYSPPLIAPDRPTLASLLEDRGYRTGIVGKWHLGLGWQHEPGTDGGNKNVDFTRALTAGAHTVGFERSFIIPGSLNMPPFVYVEDGRVTQQPTVHQKSRPFPDLVDAGVRAPHFRFDHVLDHLTQKATRLIERQADTESPFLLYFPLTAPHKPATPAPRFRGEAELGPYADLVRQIDWTVGRVVSTLERTGQKNDTLLILTSDNGSYMHRLENREKDHSQDHTVEGYRPEHHTANGPLRGTKTDIWEGGHRVPFIVQWPGEVEPGTTNDTPICLTDVLATCLQLSGGRPDNVGPDSFSFLPLLRGRAMSPDRPPIIHHSVRGMFAIRDGKWKLVLGNGSGGRAEPQGEPFQRPYRLFNMERDLDESNNVIEQHPERARQMERAARRIRETTSRAYQKAPSTP